ncbi:MAG TPA: response regulator transcription factor [Levilinea sp.]|nr:response regulator transcription factor [Levilinea sp.]
MPIRILIADDHQILRAGLRSLLNADRNFEVIGEATNGDEAIEAVKTLSPDILLMDISMPGTDGLEATRQISQTMPNVRILILTMHEDFPILKEVMNSGASGYIIKRAAESELIDAIYAVWRGILYIHPTLMQSLINSPEKSNLPDSDETEPLTSREIEVLGYIAQGYTNRQIADALTISVRTVETHRSNIMDKLNLHSRVDLVRYADEHGLEKPGAFS